MACPICGLAFAASRRKTYCSDACRSAAFRRRRDAQSPVVVVPDPQPRRLLSVYECDDCGVRALGAKYCEDCRTFMRSVGVGGCCPTCDEPISVQELLGEEVTATP
jgi:hypothetical protein